MTGPCPC